MRKFFIVASLLFTLTALSACGGNGDAPESSVVQNAATQNENNPTNVGSEQSQQWTIEELGATIVAAGQFWDEWWYLRGLFAWDEHIDDTPWDYWIEQPEHPRSRGFSVLLPSSGFESLNDIGGHLLQFYTQSWMDRELLGESIFHVEIDNIYHHIFGSPAAFEEYDGVLYVATARYGAVRPDWHTATHTLIEQDGNNAVVETTVTAYDHRGSGDEMPRATYRFVFYNCRIESGLGTWQWPDTGESSSPETAQQNVVKRISVSERDAGANAVNHFNVRIISQTFVDAGFGLNVDLGGSILVFELENISGREVTVDIGAVFIFEQGSGASLIDTDIRFSPGQARQFTHSFGEYAYADSLGLVIEYWMTL